MKILTERRSLSASSESGSCENTLAKPLKSIQGTEMNRLG